MSWYFYVCGVQSLLKYYLDCRPSVVLYPIYVFLCMQFLSMPV
jgi:hypothetical protein